MGHEIAVAAGVGAIWVILCVLISAGLYVSKRLWIMLSCQCDWSDAGLRMQVAARRKHPRHRAPRRPPLARVPASAVIRRSDHVLHPDHTEVITPVESHEPTMALPQLAPTETIERLGDER